MSSKSTPTASEAILSPAKRPLWGAKGRRLQAALRAAHCPRGVPRGSPLGDAGTDDCDIVPREAPPLGGEGEASRRDMCRRERIRRLASHPADFSKYAIGIPLRSYQQEAAGAILASLLGCLACHCETGVLYRSWQSHPIQGNHPRMCDLNPYARARKISPLVISSSFASLAKFMPFSAINIRSSGSNTKSNPLADFWSPYNEEPLDENYHFMGEYSFLFALPSDRVRGGGFRPPSATPQTRVCGAALRGGRIRGASRSTPQGTPMGVRRPAAIRHAADKSLRRCAELRRRQDAISHPDDPSRRGAHKIAQNVKFHDQPSATPQGTHLGVQRPALWPRAPVLGESCLYLLS